MKAKIATISKIWNIISTKINSRRLKNMNKDIEIFLLKSKKHEDLLLEAIKNMKQ